jgi:hypothetical protein
LTRFAASASVLEAITWTANCKPELFEAFEVGWFCGAGAGLLLATFFGAAFFGVLGALDCDVAAGFGGKGAGRSIRGVEVDSGLIFSVSMPCGEDWLEPPAGGFTVGGISPD